MVATLATNRGLGHHLEVEEMLPSVVTWKAEGMPSSFNRVRRAALAISPALASEMRPTPSEKHAVRPPAGVPVLPLVLAATWFYPRARHGVSHPQSALCRPVS